MQNKKISCLLSTYNNQDTIEDAIKSILSQTYENLELLIIDDASTDETLKICKSVNDPRVSVYENKYNLGLTKSLNKIARISMGSYLARQDGDDQSLPHRFEAQIEQFNNSNEIDIVTCRAFIKNTDKVIPKLRNKINHKLLINFLNPFIHGTLMIKRDSFYKLNGYDENFVYAQDYKLFHDAIKSGMKIETIEKPMYVLNLENNISSNKKKEQKYYSNCVRNNLIPKVKF